MSATIVFCGQGSQRMGMAQDFYEAHPQAAAVFEEASDTLGFDMAGLCFSDDPRLHMTEFTQPAILTASIAMFRPLASSIGATHFGGHSLGEYTALVAAGVIPFSEALSLVRQRGRRMQAAVPANVGAMMAITQNALPWTVLQNCLDGLNVAIANHNAPNQVVISGETKDIQTAVARYTDRPESTDAQFRPLTVSAPFHSRLMATIEPGFRALLSESAPSWTAELSHSVVSNTTGNWHTGSPDALIDALTLQISNTVRWVDNMTVLLNRQPNHIIEIGPRRTLRGFFRAMTNTGDNPLGNTELESITNLSSAQRVLKILK